MPDPGFDSTIPVEIQLTPYSCSVGATFWCLRSLGVGLSQQDLESVMVPALVTPESGLLDGSGATIVSLLQQRYSVSANNTSPVSFDDVAANAGKQPIALGGHRWFIGDDGSVTGHWVAVRGFDGTQLILANPGGTGPHFGQQALTRDDFNQRAPFAAIWFDASSGVTGFSPNQMISGTDGKGANVRSQPSTDAAIVSALKDGTPINASLPWQLVTDTAGSEGWVRTDYLISVNGRLQVANTGGTGVNLRSQPSADSERVELLAEGATLTGVGKAWCQINDARGVTGWVAAEYVGPLRGNGATPRFRVIGTARSR